ncbi:MAG TPA: DUF5615 family PIN-like protein [Polyangium sp.]|nr:DUF5615 family PIN-like protein [Polyangium sp.]
MRIKLDENLPSCLVDVLRFLGHDVDTVPQEGIQGFVDADVWEAAQTAERFFITQDLDFSDMRNFAPGTHHGLLLVRLVHPSRTVLASFVELLFRQEAVEQWAGCFVVATDTKIRVRKP